MIKEDKIHFFIPHGKSDVKWLLVLSTLLGIWIYKLAVSVINSDIFSWLVSIVFIFACVFFIIVDSRMLIAQMNEQPEEQS